MNDILQVQGINSKGFGTIPKLVMQDRRLSAQAKAIYAYFCSYAGAGKTAFPRRDKIIADLGISKGTYYKHFGLLRDCGYILSEQGYKDGRLSYNIYTLLEVVPVKPQCTKKQDTVNQDTVQCPKKQCTKKQDTVFSDTPKSNISENKQYSLNNNSQSVSQAQAAPIVEAEEDRRDETDGITAGKILSTENMTRQRIGYEYFQHHDLPLVDEIVSTIVDAVLSPEPYVTIDGENKHRALVVHRLEELSHENVEHVIWQFKGLTTPVKRKRQYLLTMLYNSKMELDAHYTNLVSTDLG